MQAGVWGAFVAVLAMGPLVAGSLEPEVNGPAPLVDGIAWELRQRGITPDEPDPWVNEAGDRMVGDLIFLDEVDEITAHIEAETGDATVGDLSAASASLAGDLVCPACVDDDDISFAYASAATKGGAALDSERLDGLDSGQFLRSDRDGEVAGSLAVLGDLFGAANLGVGFNDAPPEARLDVRGGNVRIQKEGPIVKFANVGGAGSTWQTGVNHLTGTYFVFREGASRSALQVAQDYGNCEFWLTSTGTQLFGQGCAKSAVVPTSRGLARVYAREGPEVRFVDEGRTVLVGGVARVELDPLFVDTIEGELLVHLTPEGDSQGLYVAEKGSTYFVVRESRGGTSSLPFTWMVSAHRRGFADERLEPATLG